MTKTQGLFDIQINGFAGIDFNDASLMNQKALDIALETMLASGVTFCLPTLITADKNTLMARFIALDKAVQASPLAQLMIPGYHLEGPFLNAEEGYAGCHPKSAMSQPDAALIMELEAQLSRPILLITYAPENDPEQVFAAAMAAQGKLLAIGHSKANHTEVQDAVRAGTRLSTHLGNGLPQTMHKFDNTLFAQLSEDAMSASFIADGIHIPPYVLKVLLKVKGLDRSILVTDAVSAAASPRAGLYKFAGFEVERVSDGTVRVPGAVNLAGSSLMLDQAIRNLLNWHICDFDDAITMAAVNPRQLLKPMLDQHSIQLPISEVIWDDNFNVITTTIGNIQRTYSVPS